MPITGKEVANASNVKAAFKKLFSDTSLARKLRKNMGLGDTLGPLDPEHGGLGASISNSILNPQTKYSYRNKKSVAMSLDASDFNNVGVVGRKYAAVLKKSDNYYAVLYLIDPDTGLHEKQELREGLTGNSNTAEVKFNYSDDGSTYMNIGMPTPGYFYAYSFTADGVKSLDFVEELSSGQVIDTDKDGNICAFKGGGGNLEFRRKPKNGVLSKGSIPLKTSQGDFSGAVFTNGVFIDKYVYGYISNVFYGVVAIDVTATNNNIVMRDTNVPYFSDKFVAIGGKAWTRASGTRDAADVGAQKIVGVSYESDDIQILSVDMNMTSSAINQRNSFYNPDMPINIGIGSYIGSAITTDSMIAVHFDIDYKYGKGFDKELIRIENNRRIKRIVVDQKEN